MNYLLCKIFFVVHPSHLFVLDIKIKRRHLYDKNVYVTVTKRVYIFL